MAGGQISLLMTRWLNKLALTEVNPPGKPIAICQREASVQFSRHFSSVAARRKVRGIRNRTSSSEPIKERNNMSPKILISSTADGEARELTQILKEKLEAKKDDGSHFIIGLSGGSLPKFLVQAVANLPEVDWKRVR